MLQDSTSFSSTSGFPSIFSYSLPLPTHIPHLVQAFSLPPFIRTVPTLFRSVRSNLTRWCCESAALNMPANSENSAVATGLEKVSFIPVPKKGNVKECSNYHTVALISHASKVMLKFSKPGFSNTWTKNFQMFKLDLEKAEEPEIKLATSVGSQKKQENSRKTTTLLHWLC